MYINIPLIVHWQAQGETMKRPILDGNIEAMIQKHANELYRGNFSLAVQQLCELGLAQYKINVAKYRVGKK